MAINVAPWVKEHCISTGTNPLVLSDKLSGYIRFNAAVSAGEEVWYALIDQVTGNRETGKGTFNGINTITRDTITATLVSGSYNDTNPTAINLSGSSVVVCTFTAGAYEALLVNIEASYQMDNMVEGTDAKILTAAERTKIASFIEHYLGLYTSLAALQSAHPTGHDGAYADVDLGAGNDVVRYIWDTDSVTWVEQLAASEFTAPQVKSLYESNLDTNEFSDAEQTKLADLGTVNYAHDQVVLSKTPVDDLVTGGMRWNAEDGTVDVGLDGGNAVLQVGQESIQKAYNATGSLIPNGTVVYVSGVQGSQRLQIAPAIATTAIPASTVIGISTEDIANGSNGYITTFGLVRGIDTSAFGEGNELWLSADTAGAITNIQPDAPNYFIRLGYVIRSNAGSGVIFVSLDKSVPATHAQYGVVKKTNGADDTTVGSVLKTGDAGILGAAPYFTAWGDIPQDFGGFAQVANGAVDLPTGLPDGFYIITYAGGGDDKIFAQTLWDKRSYMLRRNSGTWVYEGEYLTDYNTGTALTYDVTTSATDTTVGRLTKVGDGGFLSGTAISKTDFNDLNYTAFYSLTNGASNSPFTGYNMAALRVSSLNVNNGAELAFGVSSGDPAISFRTESGTVYSDWQELYHSGNSVNPLDYGIGGIPTTYSDWNAIPLNFGGAVTIGNTAANFPSGLPVSFYTLIYFGQNVDVILALGTTTNTLHKLRRTDSTTWIYDGEIYHSGNSVNPLDYGVGTYFAGNGTPTDLKSQSLDDLKGGLYTGYEGFNANASTGNNPWPLSGSAFQMLSMTGVNTIAGQYTSQIAIRDSFPEMKFRSSAISGYSDWKTVYHSGNTGTAVTYDVTTSTTDTTAGRLTKVGDGGLLRVVIGIDYPKSSFNDATCPSGLYRYINTTTDRPSELAAYGYVFIERYDTNDIKQTFCDVNGKRGVRLIREGIPQDFNLDYHSGNSVNPLDFGIGSLGSLPPTITDFKQVHANGLYDCILSTALNGPDSIAYNCSVLVNNNVSGTNYIVSRVAGSSATAKIWYGVYSIYADAVFWQELYHSGNTNFNEFGGGGAHAVISVGVGRTLTEILFYLPINSHSEPTGITEIGTFNIRGENNVAIGNEGLSMANKFNGTLSSTRYAVLIVGGLTNINVGQTYRLQTVDSSSKLIVNF